MLAIQLRLGVTESLSEYAKIPLGQEVESFDISPQFNGYSGIEITDENGNPVLVGENNGRIIPIPGITKTQAENILAELQSTAFRYQPHETQGALLNPAAELGDGVTINGTYSGIYKMSKRFSPLMEADISAPQDEELDHEYPFEPKQDRVYQRAIAENKAQISLTQKHIASEVTRASEAEGELNSLITQTAGSINAEVSKKVGATGGSSSTFGWNLNSTSWSLYSNGSTVFKATSSGVEVTGKITASSGKIGGFTIGSSALYNGMNNINSTANGVYVGTNGISVGGGKFKVTSSGAVSAADMTLTGTLKIGGTSITAAALRNGAAKANGWATDGTASRWSTGSGYGYNFNSAASQNGTPASYFKANTLVAGSSFTSSTRTVLEGTVYILGQSVGWKRPQDATQVLGW